MHNTGRALATQWDALLRYYCQARGWHWKTADAVGRMPAGHLVSSQLRGFLGEQSAFLPSTDPSLLQPYRWPLCLCNLRSMPGQVFWATETKKKKKKPQANRQSTSGTSLSKGKKSKPRQTVCFPFKARLVFEHERTTMGSEWVSQITVLWWVSDGAEDNAPRGLSALFLCRIHQVDSVNTN